MRIPAILGVASAKPHIRATVDRQDVKCRGERRFAALDGWSATRKFASRQYEVIAETCGDDCVAQLAPGYFH